MSRWSPAPAVDSRSRWCRCTGDPRIDTGPPAAAFQAVATTQDQTEQVAAAAARVVGATRLGTNRWSNPPAGRSVASTDGGGKPTEAAGHRRRSGRGRRRRGRRRRGRWSGAPDRGFGRGRRFVARTGRGERGDGAGDGAGVAGSDLVQRPLPALPVQEPPCARPRLVARTPGRRSAPAPSCRWSDRAGTPGTGRRAGADVREAMVVRPRRLVHVHRRLGRASPPTRRWPRRRRGC